MDLKCPKCLEPWDFDTLHEYADDQKMLYEDVAKKFRSKGCGVAFSAWGVRCEKSDSPNAAIVYEIYDLLGDDLDGAAAMLEDAEFLDFL